MDNRVQLSNLKSLNVEIKQHHIDTGIAKNTRACPLALAVREALGGEDIEVIVTPTSCWVRSTHSYDEGLFKLADEASRFIWQFDHGETVAALTCTLTNNRALFVSNDLKTEEEDNA